jgi:hypothetical protein
MTTSRKAAAKSAATAAAMASGPSRLDQGDRRDAN